MGLQEKKKRHEVETELLPNVTTELKDVTGADIAVEIDWDTFTSADAMAELEHQVLGRTLEAVKTLCEDDFAKEAVQESFKTLYVKNLDSLDERKVEFADGTLTLQTNWLDFGNIFTPGDIRGALEAGL